MNETNSIKVGTPVILIGTSDTGIVVRDSSTRVKAKNIHAARRLPADRVTVRWADSSITDSRVTDLAIQRPTDAEVIS